MARAHRVGGGRIALWQVLTANDVRLWLRFDTLPTVTEVVAAFGTRLGTQDYWQDLGQPDPDPHRLRARGGGRRRHRHPARPVPRFANVFGPLPELARPIPAIALVPVAILLFPTNEQGIVFITFLAAFFPILVSTRHAVRALPTVWEDAVRTMGGSRWDVLTRSCCPASCPASSAACRSASASRGSA